MKNFPKFIYFLNCSIIFVEIAALIDVTFVQHNKKDLAVSPLNAD